MRPRGSDGRRWPALLAGLLGLVLSAGAASEPAPPASRAELLERVQDAVHNLDRAALRRLYYWEGANSKMRTLHEQLFQDLLAKTILDVELTPLPVDYMTEEVREGVKIQLNIKPLGLLEIGVLDEKEDRAGSVTLPYGKVGNAYYIGALVESKASAADMLKKRYRVSVNGALFPDPTPFKAIYEYLENGERRKAIFQGAGHASRQFRGDQLLACVVVKTIPAAWVEVSIMEDDRLLFRSGKIVSQDPIVYRYENPAR